jgi:hypothetical protein
VSTTSPSPPASPTPEPGAPPETEPAPPPGPPAASVPADPPGGPAAAPALPASERGAAAALLLAAVALRLLGIWEVRFNSDEPQHTHVVWGWTRGLVQYRDLFDNHAPLFHMLWAPVLAALGESVRTLFWLRLTMLPLYLGALALTYAIGRRLLTRRAALWGTVLTALLPPFFVKTLEFRADVPWTLLWLAAFQVATGGALGAGRLFATGLLVGAAAAVSLKSSLLLACLLGSAVAAAAWGAAGGQRGSARTKGASGQSSDSAGQDDGEASAHSAAGTRSDARDASTHSTGSDRWDAGARRGDAGAAFASGGAGRKVLAVLAAAGAALAGLLAVPAALLLYFQRRGALDALLAGAVRHNLQVSQHGPGGLKRAAILAAGVPLLMVIARWSLRAGPPALARQRLLLALTAGSYLIAMQVLWPLITSQTYLPVEPLVCLFMAAAALGAASGRRAAAGTGEAAPGAAPVQEPAAAMAGAAARRSRTARPARAAAGPAFVALALAVELCIDLLHGPLRGDQTRPATAIVAAALRLTGPGETVFDDKGDMVFRRRAFAPVLEDITREAMARGRIADTIPESILASRACVATLDSRRLPPRGRQFLAGNFLPVGPVRVCGKWLPEAAVPGALTGGSAALPGPREIRFAVAVPARYIILGAAGPAHGRLDGVELAGSRQLAAGVHVFETLSPPPLALIWARAVERGFFPFPPAGGGDPPLLQP